MCLRRRIEQRALGLRVADREPDDDRHGDLDGGEGRHGAGASLGPEFEHRGAEHVVVQRLCRVGLDQRDMLEGGGMVDRVRAEGLQDARAFLLVEHRAQERQKFDVQHQRLPHRLQFLFD